jgi:predicted DNA-binding transcriptional regulator AlpA
MVTAMAAVKLAGVAEVSEILGVTKQTALKYAARDDFPEPIDRLASGPVWKRVDVERWGKKHPAKVTGRRFSAPGRPPQQKR